MEHFTDQHSNKLQAIGLPEDELWYDEAMKALLRAAIIEQFLEKQLGRIKDLQQMTEGEKSQTFSFKHEQTDFVIRVHPSVEGYKKDKYAYDHFASAKLPIPRVVQLGYIDNDHAFCISEKINGITFQDADEATVERLLEPVTELWKSVGAVDISGTTGFGDFDSSGIGQSKSWGDYLTLVIDDYDWGSVRHLIDHALFDALSNELRRLVSKCPEEHHLVHGDFGSNNVLVESDKVTALIDWENALYGDRLFDVAYVYFWRTWLMCMEKSAAYWDAKLNDLPNYYERLRCYQLRVGLHEIFDNASDGNINMVNWMQDRCRQIFAEKH